MAKRRKEKDEDEDKAFKLPKFNEEEFLKRERRNIKTTIISFLFGLLISLITFGFYTLLSGNDVRWYLILLLGIFTGSWLKYIYTKLKIDISDFTKKNWFSSYAIYLMTWLVLLMVLVNPPFHDEETPIVKLVLLPEMQEPGGDILIIAKITDNTNIEKEDILLKIDDTAIENFEYIDDVLRYTYKGPDSITSDETHKVEISVKDSNNLETIKEKTFIFSNDTITVPEPVGTNTYPGPEVGHATTIKINVKPEVSRVYYIVDNTKEINATIDEETLYETKPIQNGWPNNGTIVSIKPYAEIVYYFQNIEEKFSNTITDNQVYYFNATKDPNIGTEDNVAIGLPKPYYVGAPGFELIILLASIAVVFIIIKQRKKDKSN